MKTNTAIFVTSLLLATAIPAHAVPYGMLLESDADRNGGAELYALTYKNWDDVLANNIDQQGYAAIDINPLFSTAGFTFDGSAYRMLLESNDDRNSGAELYEL